MRFIPKSTSVMVAAIGLLAMVASTGTYAFGGKYPDLPFFESDIKYCEVDNEMISERIGRYLEGKSDGQEQLTRFYRGYTPKEADRANRTCLAYNLGMEAIRNQYHDKLVFELCEGGAPDCVEMQNGIWLRQIASDERP